MEQGLRFDWYADIGPADEVDPHLDFVALLDSYGQSMCEATATLACTMKGIHRKERNPKAWCADCAIVTACPSGRHSLANLRDVFGVATNVEHQYRSELLQHSHQFKQEPCGCRSPACRSSAPSSFMKNVPASAIQPISSCLFPA
jgi:hypothetical protein